MDNEEDDFPATLSRDIAFNSFEIFNGDDIRSNSSFALQRFAPSAQSTIFLCRVFRHPGNASARRFSSPRTQCGTSLSPVALRSRSLSIRPRHIQPLRGLRRAGQARSDIVGEMRDLPIRVIAAQRRLLQTFRSASVCGEKTTACSRRGVAVDCLATSVCAARWRLSAEVRQKKSDCQFVIKRNVDSRRDDKPLHIHSPFLERTLLWWR